MHRHRGCGRAGRAHRRTQQKDAPRQAALRRARGHPVALRHGAYGFGQQIPLAAHLGKNFAMRGVGGAPAAKALQIPLRSGAGLQPAQPGARLALGARRVL
ncbi:hypothetical protein D3C86_1695190 [compost metagenome]